MSAQSDLAPASAVVGLASRMRDTIVVRICSGRSIDVCIAVANRQPRYSMGLKLTTRDPENFGLLILEVADGTAGSLLAFFGH
jgi:hypothetical protein